MKFIKLFNEKNNKHKQEIENRIKKSSILDNLSKNKKNSK